MVAEGRAEGQPVPFAWLAWGQLADHFLICVVITCRETPLEVTCHWPFPLSVQQEESSEVTLCV